MVMCMSTCCTCNVREAESDSRLTFGHCIVSHWYERTSPSVDSHQTRTFPFLHAVTRPGALAFVMSCSILDSHVVSNVGAYS